jgi:hypothetical protein
LVKIPKKDFFLFLLFELEVADLGCFFEKNGLGPLGVKCQKIIANILGYSGLKL